MTSSRTIIDFHFDFLSPYAYYARHRLAQIAQAHGAEIAYHPHDLTRLKLAAGNTGPATVQMPRKLAYAIKDFERWGGRYGIPAATRPACRDVRDLNVGTFFAAAQGQVKQYVELGLAAVWGQGGKLQDAAELAHAVVQGSGLNVAAWQGFVDSPQAEQAIEAAFDAATAAGVFGVPTVRIDGELWWGNDRLFMLDEHLAARKER